MSASVAGELRVRLEEGVDVTYPLYVRRHAAPPSPEQAGSDEEREKLQRAHKMAQRTAIVREVPPGWEVQEVGECLAKEFGPVEEAEGGEGGEGARVRFGSRKNLRGMLERASARLQKPLEPPPGAGGRRGMRKWVEEHREEFPGAGKVGKEANAWLEEWERRPEEGQVDEEGFVKVGKRGAAHPDHHSRRKKKRSSASMDDLYRFKRRERRRDEIAELQRKFEEDRARLESLKRARKFKPA